MTLLTLRTCAAATTALAPPQGLVALYGFYSGEPSYVEGSPIPIHDRWPDGTHVRYALQPVRSTEVEHVATPPLPYGSFVKFEATPGIANQALDLIGLPAFTLAGWIRPSFVHDQDGALDGAAVVLAGQIGTAGGNDLSDYVGGAGIGITQKGELFGLIDTATHSLRIREQGVRLEKDQWRYRLQRLPRLAARERHRRGARVPHGPRGSVQDVRPGQQLRVHVHGRRRFSDVVVAEALIAAAETNAEIGDLMTALIHETVATVTDLLRLEYPDADAKSTGTVAYGVVGISLNHESLAPLALPPRYRRSAKAAASGVIHSCAAFWSARTRPLLRCASSETCSEVASSLRLAA
ncbi:MAG: hypothetical protein GY711_00345, partial [bacterium]|nr:hypothetical protein [bacterium]